MMTRVLYLRVPDELHERLASEAEAAGTTLNGYVRVLLENSYTPTVRRWNDLLEMMEILRDELQVHGVTLPEHRICYNTQCCGPLPVPHVRTGECPS